jgi:hypothetical protein
MGEISDMMLDGTLCEACGEFIDDDQGGEFPRRCAACSQEDPPEKPKKKGKNGKAKHG